MVHNRVSKWSTFCFEFLEADVDHLLTPDFCFTSLFFKLYLVFLPAERRIFIKQKTKKETVDHLLTQQRVKCGPLIDPTISVSSHQAHLAVVPVLLQLDY